MPAPKDSHNAGRKQQGKKRHMQQMTEIDLRTMLAETKHVLTIADIASVVELDNAASVVVSGPADKSGSIYAFPLLCGGEAFCAPSIGKQIFWEEQVATALPEKWLTCAYLWLLTCPEVPEQRGGDIIKAVKRWGRKCKLTTDDIAKVIATYSTEDNGGESANYGEIVSLLVREYGQDCTHWLNAPESEINMLLADWTRRQEAKAAAYRSSKAGSKNPLPPMPSPKIKALKTYRELKEKLRASWLEK